MFGAGLGIGSKIWLGPNALNPKPAGGGSTFTMTISPVGSNSTGPDPTVGTGSGQGMWDSNGTSSAGAMNGANPAFANAACLLPFTGRVSHNTFYAVALAWQDAGASNPFGGPAGPVYMFSVFNGPSLVVNAADFTSINFPSTQFGASHAWTMASATFVAKTPDVSNRGGTWIWQTTDTAAVVFDSLFVTFNAVLTR